ncbi:hypothetical protein F5887DRAFT_1026083 [Amanita rubescens]|nr:hypothetical protein F5887DRAFT_1026083 [Amanita rubescens]
MFLMFLIISLAVLTSVAFQAEDAPMTTPVRPMKPTELCGCSARVVLQELDGHPRPRLNQRRLFESPIAVTRLDKAKLQEVMKSPRLGIVAYVSSTCGYSITQYADALQNLPRSLPSYVVDCDNTTLSHLCPACPRVELRQQAGLDTLPVQILPWKTMVQLDRDAKSEENVLESMSNHLPNYIDELSTMREVNQWLEKYNDEQRVLVVVEDGTFLPTWKILAAKFLGHIRIATIARKAIWPQGYVGIDPTWKFKIYHAKTSSIETHTYDMIIVYISDVDFNYILRILSGCDLPSQSGEWAEIYQETQSVMRKLWGKFKRFIKTLERGFWRVKGFLIKVDTRIIRKIRKVIARVDWGFCVAVAVAVRFLMKARRRLGIPDRLLRGSLKLLLIGLPVGLWRVMTLLWIISAKLTGTVWKIL